MNTTKPKCLIIASTKYFFPGFLINTKYHLISILTYLVDIAEIEVVDFEVMFGFPQDLEAVASFQKRAERVLRLLKYEPDVVGISCYSTYDYLCSVDLIGICNKLFPKAVIAVGGYHPTAVPEDFQELPVDYIIRGEGELVLREIAASGKKADRVVIDGIDLKPEQMKPLRYDLYPQRSSASFVEVSRGCPYRCTFCVESEGFSKRYRTVPVELFKENLRALMKQPQVTSVYFNDSFFGRDRETTHEIIDFLTENYPEVSYWAETRLENFSRDWFRRLRNLNFVLNAGLESLSEDTLRLMNKTRNPAEYIESFHRAVSFSQEEKIPIDFSVLLNYPGELVDSYLGTIASLRKTVEESEQVNFKYCFNIYQMFPGNQIYYRRQQLQKERGFIYNNDGWWRVRETGLLDRCQNCIASKEIADYYGGDNKFWRKDVDELQDKLRRKYSFKAFRVSETTAIMGHAHKHYGYSRGENISSNEFRETFELVARYQYAFSRLRYEYEIWLRDEAEVLRNAVLAILDSRAAAHREETLLEHDRGGSLGQVLEMLECYFEERTAELENNRKNGNGGRICLFGAWYGSNAAGEMEELTDATTPVA